MEQLLKNKYVPFLMLFAIAIIVYGLIYMFSSDFSITAYNQWNPFSIQAASWLDGRLYLEENIPWLEVAMFNGQYFISFPPFPSIIMLIFVPFHGTDTPDHAIALVVSLLSLAYAYKIGEKVLGNKTHAMFLSLFLVLGTNYLHISLWGAVWYIAQNMAFLLTLMAFYYALTDKKYHSFISLFAMCAALGCRPFNAIYVPVVLYLIFIREDKSFFAFAKKASIYAIPAMLLGSFFAWLNYARFGNIFEFGHSYLPEFAHDPYGQFYAGRILSNLETIFFNFNMTGFPLFGGFAFWVASPIIISFVIYFFIFIFKDIKIKTPCRKKCLEKYLIFAIPLLVMIHIVAFSFHRTLGGHQFGSRYTVDVLVAIYLGLLLMLKRLPQNNSVYINAAPFLFGMLLNFYGTINFLSFYF